MKFFDGLFKGFGLVDERENNDKKSSDNMDKNFSDKYTSFDNGLANSFVVNEFKNPGDVSSMPNLSGISGSNLIIYAPKENKDIKILIECLRRREACIVNLGLLRASDAEKILQFLSGAVYALKGSIKRLQGDLFLMTPEGINIMTQSKK